MRVKTRQGKFASKDSAIFKFVKRTGKTADEYYEWASECGKKGSLNNKNRKICDKFGLDNIQELVSYKTLDCSDFINENELHDYILEHCENPSEMAASYLEVKQQWQDYEDKNDFIQANLSRFPKASFERWSDINLIAQVSPSWFDSKGLALDVQAEALSEAFYVEITIQDLIDHILNYKKGKYVNDKHILIGKYLAKLEDLCGFSINHNYATHLANLIFECEENELVELESSPF